MCYVSNKLLLSVGIHQAFNSVGSQIKVTEQSKGSLKKNNKREANIRPGLDNGLMVLGSGYVDPVPGLTVW